MHAINDTAATPTDEKDPAQTLLALLQHLMEETHATHSVGVTLDSSFDTDLGLDSLDRVELMLRVGKAFGVTLPARALSEIRTGRELLGTLRTSLPALALAQSDLLDKPPTKGVPDAATTLLEVLQWHAQQQPDRTHILLIDEQHTEQTISYGELLDEAHSVAALLLPSRRPDRWRACCRPTSRP